MRERNLLHLFLVLNVGLAVAFVVYILLSSSHQPKVVTSNFENRTLGKARVVTNASVATPLKTDEQKAKASALNTSKTNEAKEPASIVSQIRANQNKTAPPRTENKFTWEKVESDDYVAYLRHLRDIGCPEDKIRYIVLADVNELFAKKRLKEAVTHDQEWWRAEQLPGLVQVLQEKGRLLDEERHALLAKLLGSAAAESEKSEVQFWSSVQLTGPVLGNLSPETHQTVQEICSRSMERHQSVFWARANEGQPLNAVEMARLREQTRSDLRPVVNGQELEEFLLRYSHNANRLRNELRGVEPTPDEFRKIFRAVDPIDHQMQLEYGGVEALSQMQKERFERQRDAAIKEVLSPERYPGFLLTKDPVYREAQMAALQFNAPAKAVMPIYEMTKVNKSKRQQIINDTTLTPQQKSQALQAMDLEQQQSIRQIVTEAASPR